MTSEEILLELRKIAKEETTMKAKLEVLELREGDWRPFDEAMNKLSEDEFLKIIELFKLR